MVRDRVAPSHQGTSLTSDLQNPMIESKLLDSSGDKINFCMATADTSLADEFGVEQKCE